MLGSVLKKKPQISQTFPISRIKMSRINQCRSSQSREDYRWLRYQITHQQLTQVNQKSREKVQMKRIWIVKRVTCRGKRARVSFQTIPRKQLTQIRKKTWKFKRNKDLCCQQWKRSQMRHQSRLPLRKRVPKELKILN